MNKYDGKYIFEEEGRLITCSAKKGTDIYNCTVEALGLSKERDQPVIFRFNETEIIVDYDKIVSRVIDEQFIQKRKKE